MLTLLINYSLFQKLKLLEYGLFNNLIIILTLYPHNWLSIIPKT